MAVDQKKLDKLTSSRVTPNSELGDLTEVQNQLGAINAERQNNLSQEAIQSRSIMDNNSNLRTAVEIGTSGNGGNVQQVPVTPSNELSPATRSVLAGYGVNPKEDKSSVTSSNSSSTKSNKSNSNLVNGQGVVNNSTSITNVTNNNTKSDTKVEVVNRGVEVQRPTIPIANQEGTSNSAKFKAWLSNIFAKQNERHEIQRKEYEKRDWSLRRSGEKLTKKLGEVTKSVANKLDPTNMGRSMSSQLGIMLTIVGTALLSKYWDPIRAWMHTFENDFKTVFGLAGADKSKSEATFLGRLNSSIGKFFGGDGDKSFISSISDSIKSGLDELIDKVKLFFDERGTAAKAAWDAGKNKSVLNVSGQLERIGNTLVAALGGPTAAANSIITSEAEDNLITDNNKRVSGVRRKKLARGHDIDEAGDLTDIGATTASHIAGSKVIGSSKEVDSTNISYITNKIYDKNKDDEVKLNSVYIKNILDLSNEQISNLIKSGLARRESGVKETMYLKRGALEIAAFTEREFNDRVSKGHIKKEDVKDYDKIERDYSEGEYLVFKKGALKHIEDELKKTVRLGDLKSIREFEDRVAKIKSSVHGYDKSEVTSNISGPAAAQFKINEKFSKKREDLGKKYEDSNWNKTVDNAKDLIRPLTDSVSELYNQLAPSKVTASEITKAEEIRNTKIAIDKLSVDLGISKEMAAGIAGVLLAESRLNPKAVNKEELNSGKKGFGAGIAQWSNDRKEEFKKDTGKDILDSTLEEQLNYIVKDLKENRSNTLSALKKSNSMEGAVDAFLRGYENGGNGLASIEAINEVKGYQYQRRHGRTPYDQMMHDRLSNAKGALSLIDTKEGKTGLSQSSPKELSFNPSIIPEVYTSGGMAAPSLESTNISRTSVVPEAAATPKASSISKSKVDIPKATLSESIKPKTSSADTQSKLKSSDNYMADNRQISDNHSVTVTNNFYGDNKNSAQILNT